MGKHTGNTKCGGKKRNNVSVGNSATGKPDPQQCSKQCINRGPKLEHATLDKIVPNEHQLVNAGLKPWLAQSKCDIRSNCRPVLPQLAMFSSLERWMCEEIVLTTPMNNDRGMGSKTRRYSSSKHAHKHTDTDTTHRHRQRQTHTHKNTATPPHTNR